MPVKLFTDGIEPRDPDTPIWRFLELWKFQDLMKGHMYFRRSDLFPDDSEGLPPDGYDQQALGLGQYDLKDIEQRRSNVGFIAQMRQSYYITCWYLDWAFQMAMRRLEAA